MGVSFSGVERCEKVRERYETWKQTQRDGLNALLQLIESILGMMTRRTWSVSWGDESPDE
ncbi:MAG: hypothetical protein VYC71_13300 [Planctomycetota bacterium]|nr:hypothetical protein [Planctomycetota bacterium]